jgi:lipoprotein NlpI
MAYGQQLDHLGKTTAALEAFRRAQALDPDIADLDEALTVNAFLRRADADVERHAARALQMSPGNVGPRYTRGWSRYFAGDYGAAREEWQSLLQERSEQERSYAAIWLYLSVRRLGGDGAAAVQAWLPKEDKPAWPYPALQWLLGKGDFKQALAATREGDQTDAGRECELYLFAAQKALLDGDVTAARAYLRKSLDTRVVEFNEYAMAQRELDRLSKP